MSPGTDEEFQDALDEDLAWRRAELGSLRDQLRRASSADKDSPATRALSRGLAVLLYAHWEGYTKQAFDRYLQLVLRRKVRVCEASDGLALSHVARLAGRVVKGDDADARSAMVELVRGSTKARLSLQKDLVNARSNLRFDVLVELLDLFNVPVEEFETKRNLIDVKLCDQRNAIAHGRGNFPPADEVLKLHDMVLELLVSLRERLIDAVRARSYRLRPVGTLSVAAD